VIRFLRALRTILSGSQVVSPTKQLGLRLDAIEGALQDDQKFPRPQWKIIHAWIKQHVAADDLPSAWEELAFDWLTAVTNRLGGNYSVNRSRNFLLLTSRKPHAIRSILETSEVATQHLVRWLGPIAEKRGHGPHVVMDFATVEQYYDYISYFYPANSETAGSSGVFLGRGYQHIAIPPSNWMQDTLIHELTHNRLVHLPLPLWLEEGIAVTMERKIGGRKGGTLDRELQRKHHQYWSSETIPAFWNGRSFKNPDGEISHLSYSLAEILVDLMVQEFPNFMEFVGRANGKDAGQAAAKEVFDVTLNDIASAFLGPGEWTAGFAVP
jgi:hypothetical protein